MTAFISTIISSLIKSIIPCGEVQSKLVSEVGNSILKNISLVVVLSTLFTSLILVLCGGISYYLSTQGFSVVQSIGIIIAIKLVFILTCVILLRKNIKKMGNIDNSSDKEDKKLPHYNVIGSFIDGFNKK